MDNLIYSNVLNNGDFQKNQDELGLNAVYGKNQINFFGLSGNFNSWFGTNLRKLFRSSNGFNSKNTSATDLPGQRYFKILFHFYNGDSESEINETNSGGLLYPIFEASQSILKSNTTITDALTENINTYSDSEVDNLVWSDPKLLRSVTCAWTYLKLNDEQERANNLKQFIRLLSNISTESPWYFQSIEGVDAAIERKNVGQETYKIDEERQKITIKCLKDAVDDRIGTLLDLYRSVVYSYINKRYVLPSNLRKFDMSLLIYDPYMNISQYSTSTTSPSYKYIEFHNCEIDYNSTRSGYSGLSNVDGIAPEYSIDIFYDDVYENRYNEFLINQFGDFVSIDTGIVSQLGKVENKSQSGFLSNAIGQLAGAVVNPLANVLKSAALGNLYTLSLTEGIRDIRQLAEGDVIGTYKNIQSKINNEKVRNRGQKGGLDTLFETSIKETNEKIIGAVNNIGSSYKMNAYPLNPSTINEPLFEKDIQKYQQGRSEPIFDQTEKITEEIEELGNLYTSKTLLNNL